MTQPDLFTPPPVTQAVTPNPVTDGRRGRASSCPPAPRERKPNPVAQERQRLNAAARRVLAYLERHREATNVELCDPAIGGMRAVGRLHELKRDGWVIDKQHITGGLWRYTLVGRKGQA